MADQDALYSVPDLTAIYDQINSDRSDFDFYRSRLPKTPSCILDIGCGTGSFTLELAQIGHQVTGLDPAPNMLAFARTKPGADEVTWMEGDSSALDQHGLFDVAIMTGHAFQCLLTDEQIIRLFQDVALTLKPDGSFWFETRNKAARPWERWTPEHTRDPLEIGNGRSVQIIHDTLSIEAETVTFQETYHFLPEDKRLQSISTLRFVSAKRIQELAIQAGLATTEIWGDWQGNPFGAETSPEIIFQLKLQRSRD